MMEKEALISKIEAIKPILQAEGVAHLDLFGSRARGNPSPTSDLDILIDVDPSARFSLIDLVGVEHLVGEATGIPANAFMRRSLDDNFLRSISRDVIKVPTQ
jgi:uncharacterized protein